MSQQGITITGLDECLKMFDQAPKNMLKVSQKAARAASTAVAKQIKQRSPDWPGWDVSRWKALVRYKLGKNSKGQVTGYIGLFNGKQQHDHHGSGDPAFDWSKVYWNNYGTLANRDPNHHFATPIKKGHYKNIQSAKHKKERSGVKPPTHFFEAAISGWETTYVSAFQKSLKDQEDKLYER